METTALRSLRKYDAQDASEDEVVHAVTIYSREFLWDKRKSDTANNATLSKNEAAIRRTLQAKPWKHCDCRVCKEAGIETVIFRGSNRNKRRGFHNLRVYYEHVRRTVR